MRKSTLDKLEEIYLTGDFDNTENKCKFFALFAFGQAYSIRSEPSLGLRVPGTAYFAKAMSLVQILPERTSITHLETLLTLVSVANVHIWSVVSLSNDGSSLYSHTISIDDIQPMY